MKVKKLNKSLVLNKTTVANLGHNEMTNALGGVVYDSVYMCETMHIRDCATQENWCRTLQCAIDPHTAEHQCDADSIF
ncbi:MAG: hypothetical protein GY765_38060, partial [bacterium]|nr:hypothetical protein [bacterium]